MKWISIKERLPEERRYVLTWLPEIECSFTMYWNGFNWVNRGGNTETIYDVTHWMPLPEPPKESD